MSDIATALKAIATANAPLTALVSTRVYHGDAPQNDTLPYVCFTRISDLPGRVYGATTLSGARRAHYQFDVWASTVLSATSTAAAVFTAFDDYRGTSDTIVIDKILMEFGPEVSGEGGETEERVILEAWVNYRV